MFPAGNTGLERPQNSSDSSYYWEWNTITVCVNKYKINYTLLISDCRGEIYISI